MSRELPADGGTKRRIVPRGSSVELTLLVMMLVVALGSGSVTLLGETMRSALITATGVWAFMVHAKATRDPGQRYEFGVGKLEQAGHASIALAFAVTGLWVASRAFNLIMVGGSEAEPLGLALAATANAVHTIRSGFLLRARATPVARNQGPTHGVPPPAGPSRLVPLLIVQTTLTVAALARDPAIALAADCAGGIFVGLLMTVAGIRILWEAVPDLIDHPLRRKDEEAIAQLLFEQGVDAKELVAMRSRRSGRDVFVELTMDPVEAGSFEDTCRRLARLRQSLEARLDGLDLSIKLHPPPT
jgi:divalent metal cation (Fe/Co/Zn/Cd) transporter